MSFPTFTYDPSTDRGRVRLLIGDTSQYDETNQLFNDDEIDAFLSIEGDAVLLAAARALYTMAANQVMVLKVITRGDISLNGASVGAELRKQADALRVQYQDSLNDPSGTIDWAEMVEDPFSRRERFYKQILRGGL